MASLIDPTKPADGVPADKADLRTNLGHAASEITALQASLAGALTPSNFAANTGASFLGFDMGSGAPQTRFLSASMAKALSHDAAGTGAFPNFQAGGIDMAVRFFGTLSANRSITILAPTNAANQAYAAVFVDGVSQSSFQITVNATGLTSFNPKTNLIYGLRWNGSAWQDWGSWPKGDFNAAVQALIGGATGFWARQVVSTNALTVDAAVDKKLVELTHTAGHTTVTFASSTPEGAEGRIVRNVGPANLVICQFTSPAGQVLPQDTTLNTDAFNLVADHVRWRVLNNPGNAARYLITLEPGRHSNARSIPSAIAAEHASWVFRVHASGTTTLPAGSTLRSGWACTVINPAGSGLSRTLQGPTNQLILAAGQTATLNVTDDGNLIASSGANQVL